MKSNKKYLKNIKKLLPMYGNDEKAFLNVIQNQINGFDNYNYNQLVAEFGEPKDVVAIYLKQADNDKLLQNVNIRRIIKITCIILTVVALFICLWRIYILNQAYDNFHDSVPVEYEETIEEVN